MIQDTAHFREMLEERGIAPEWADRALREPERTEEHPDGTRHYLCRIAERDGRWLRVVVNIQVNPPKRITVFFDRRLGRRP